MNISELEFRMKSTISDMGIRNSDLTRRHYFSNPTFEIRNPKSRLSRSRRSNPGGNPPGSPGHRGAFTLVEMLVAVGLVVLMMTLFATIFQMATGAMSTQKGLSENDQRVRLVLSRLRSDLNGNKSDANDPNRPYRTFRNLVPYGPDESPLVTLDRDGYFYISENDPNDDTDDVLALTVYMPTGSPERFTGRAAVVFPDSAGNYGTFNNPPAAQPPQPAGGNPYPPPAPASITAPANNPNNGQQYFQNQPEFDDIQGTPNLAGSSPYAEVCYFLRRGTLYRRVMLIRQPNLGGVQVQDGTPTDNAAVALNVAAIYGANGTRNTWTDFDYAAYYDMLSGLGLRFHGTGNTLIDSLATGASSANPWVPPFVLGNPAYRFGFDCTTVLSGGVQVPTANYGQPREYITTGAPATYFIGRFTHSETSDPTFGYPGNITGGSGNPLNSATTLNYNSTTGQVSNYSGPRGGEDVLMTNVLKFDIKVFDPAASVGPDGQPGVAGADDDGDGNFDVLPNGNPDLKELGWPGSDDGDFRDIGHLGATGFYSATPRNVPVTMIYNTFPPTGTYNMYPPAGSAYYAYPNTNYSNPVTNRNRFDTWNPRLSLTNTLDTSVTPNIAINECPPFRPFNFGTDGAPGQKNVDDDGDGNPDYLPNGTYDPKELGYPGTDDQPIALRAIQIKIVFYDRTSKQIRETTLIQSLLYQP